MCTRATLSAAMCMHTRHTLRCGVYAHAPHSAAVCVHTHHTPLRCVCARDTLRCGVCTFAPHTPLRCVLDVAERLSLARALAVRVFRAGTRGRRTGASHSWGGGTQRFFPSRTSATPSS
eukprot:7761100-Pyramimonas_sp.AAC.1